MSSLAAPSFVAKIRRRVRRHGLAASFYAYGMRRLNSAVSIKVLRALCLERANPVLRRCPDGYRAGFASQEALQRYVQQPDAELSPKFVAQALARGDQCFAICDRDALAAYGWHSFRPTPMDLPGLMLHFDRRWVYRYKGFTLPRYRGQRLHAIGMTLALEHYLSRGFCGLISYVDSTNLESLKSCLRAGHRPFGRVCVVQGLGRTLAFCTPGCERLGLRAAPYALSPFGTP